jgi:hypothetical protein
MDCTLLDERVRIMGRENCYLSITETQRDLDQFMEHCNLERTHQGYTPSGSTPAQALREALGLESRPDLRFDTLAQPIADTPSTTAQEAAFRPYLLVGSVNRSNRVASCLVSSRLENLSANFG